MQQHRDCSVMIHEQNPIKNKSHKAFKIFANLNYYSVFMPLLCIKIIIKIYYNYSSL